MEEVLAWICAAIFAGLVMQFCTGIVGRLLGGERSEDRCTRRDCKWRQ